MTPMLGCPAHGSTCFIAMLYRNALSQRHHRSTAIKPEHHRHQRNAANRLAIEPRRLEPPALEHVQAGAVIERVVAAAAFHADPHRGPRCIHFDAQPHRALGAVAQGDGRIRRRWRKGVVDAGCVPETGAVLAATVASMATSVTAGAVIATSIGAGASGVDNGVGTGQ